MKTIKRVVVMTEKGQVLPLNTQWSDKFCVPVNVNRYILPLIGCKCIVAISRGYIWIGNHTWQYKINNQLWDNATSAQKSDNTLWL